MAHGRGLASVMTGSVMPALRKALHDSAGAGPLLAQNVARRRGLLGSGVKRELSQPAKVHERVQASARAGSRLEELRATLAQEQKTVDDFLPAAAEKGRGLQPDGRPLDTSGMSAEAAAAAKKRDEELNRSVLGQLKPDYAKADGSFKHLRSIVKDPEFRKVKDALRGLDLVTVCEEAKCPNIGECWGGKSGTATATIMLMGDTCTRACKFCHIKTSKTPAPVDKDEPRKVAEAITRWGLDYVVLTSVDRDDMADGGAGHFAETIQTLKLLDPNIRVEALVSDFQGDTNCVRRVVESGLDVYAHNIETVERLQGRVRDLRAGYRQSLATLEHARSLRSDLVTKSSIMLGVGEKDEEVMQALRDLRSAGVEIVTFGQYLRPTRKHVRVYEYVALDKYEYWRKEGEAMGFAYVASAPLVRSSYKAGEVFINGIISQRRAAVAGTVTGSL